MALRPEDSYRPLQALSICSGVGGLELGLHQALRRAGHHVRTVCYLEREAYAASVLVRRMEEGALDQAPIWSDLSTFDPEPWRGVVDIVAGGYPCSPFSVAGKQRAHEDERHLWPHVAGFIERLEPRLVCFENVANHLRLGGHDVFSDLQRLGYRTAASLWTAEEVGAPHRRERIFIVGVRA